MQNTSFNSKIKTLLVAFSGGVDSSVLLHLIKQKIPFAKVVVVIVNHNLRSGSTAEAELVKQNALKYNFKEVEVLEWQHEKITNGVEEKARNARQKLIFEYAKKHKIKDIFIGHHADDAIEGLFLKLGRGGGCFSLSQITPLKKFRYSGCIFNIHRPLCYVFKNDIILYAKEHNLFYVNDETNITNTYKRNRIRLNMLQIFDLLESNPLNILQSIKSIESANSITKNYILNIFKTKIRLDKKFGFFSCKYDTIGKVSKNELFICLKQIIFYLSEISEVRMQKIENAITFIYNKRPFTLYGIEVFFNKDNIFFIRERSKMKNCDALIWDARFIITSKEDNFTTYQEALNNGLKIMNKPVILNKILHTLPLKLVGENAFFIDYKEYKTPEFFII